MSLKANIKVLLIFLLTILLIILFRNIGSYGEYNQLKECEYYGNYDLCNEIIYNVLNSLGSGRDSLAIKKYFEGKKFYFDYLEFGEEDAKIRKGILENSINSFYFLKKDYSATRFFNFLEKNNFEEEFEDLEQKFKLSPIPEVILRVYRRIFK